MDDVKGNELSVLNLNSLYASDSTSTDQYDLFIKSRKILCDLVDNFIKSYIIHSPHLLIVDLAANP